MSRSQPLSRTQRRPARGPAPGSEASARIVGFAGWTQIKRAEVADAHLLGRLQHESNTEFDQPEPDASMFSEPIAHLLEEGL